MVDWDDLRGIYQDRFHFLSGGVVVDGRDEPFCVLEFSRIDEPSYAYVTFAASAGPLRHEVAIVTLEAFARFGDAVEAVVHGGAVVAPLAVVPCVIAGTPFVAALALPLEDGSVLLGEAEGEARYLFLLAPLTRGERALAERDPERALEVLRAGFALIADPHRACLVEGVTRPAPGRPENAAARRNARSALLALQERWIHRRPDILEMDSEFVRGEEQIRLRPRSGPALVHAAGEILERALYPIADTLPPRVMFVFAEVLYVTLATHPDAVRLLDRIFDPAARSVPEPRRPGGMAPAAVAKVLDDLVAAIAACHPRADEAVLRARGQRAVEEATLEFDPEDEIPIENHVWTALCPALYEVVPDLAGRHSATVVAALRNGLYVEAVLELDPDARPPLVRLRAIAARIASALYVGYVHEHLTVGAAPVLPPM